ncbi:hypothetical protein G3P36_004942 [Salmonella enterica]|nr:hypothetical protein [Salmonella enterica]EEI2972861.1 hypothetical protein [Salmonella enterica]
MKQKDRLYGVAPALPRLQAVKLGRRSAMCLRGRLRKRKIKHAKPVAEAVAA